MKELTITFVGSGNVANAFARKFAARGFVINNVISRNRETASEIASATGASVSESFVVAPESDLVIVAVPDNAIGDVISKLSFHGEPVVVHTSGTTDLTVFPERIKRYGVIYPLQTFTRGREIINDEINIFTEASDEETHSLIDSVSTALSLHQYHINSEERRILHLSAVFVSNFVNHMLLAGFETVSMAGIDPVVLRPLINETVEKAFIIGPDNAQTGPAKRNDTQTIKKHVELLSFSDDLKNLYIMVSDSIIKQSHKKK